nr:glycosyltransferase [uncultured bacterium]
MDTKRPIIVSAADDAYMEFLDDMLASIQNRLHEYDLGILDLGLSKRSLAMIRARKEDARVVDPGWRYQPADMSKQPPYKKVYYAKPYLPDIFPGHVGYMWIDADVWFQDSSAIEHYISASEKTPGRGSIAFECHPNYKDINYKPRFRMVRKYRILPVAIRLVGRKTFRLVYDMFGDEAARTHGLAPDNNSGLFFIHADSPAWKAWQHYMRKANHLPFMDRKYFPDQTCLNVALRERNISFHVMQPIYNWIVGLGLPMLDENTHALLDPCSPHKKIYAIHLAGSAGFQPSNLRTTSGNHASVQLKMSKFYSETTANQ